jgi:type VI secretion system protein VasJ
MSLFSTVLKSLFGARDPDDLMRERIDTWADWLDPLPGADGIGRDPGYEDAFFAIKDELTKLSGIDDALVARSCEQLLKETGKDLRLAAYYTFARLRQHGTAGFADGLELTAALVERFGESLLPARPEAKKGALDWLATSRMIDPLASIDANATGDPHASFSAADLERAMAALNLLVTRTGQWTQAARPNLQPLISRFESRTHPVQPSSGYASPTPSTLQTTHGSHAPIASTRDLLEQTRAMAHYLRAQENGYLPAARLIRCVRWDTIHELPPADAQSRTRLPAPRAELRQQLRRLVLQKHWHELLERVESAFAEGANHLWFDLQYFQHTALDHAGAPHSEWRDLLRTDFALLLARLAGIERLAYADGTPFADDATLDWIARHAVVRDLEAGETLAPLPVSGDDADAGDWVEMEAQARDLLASQGLDAAYVWLAALPGVRSDRQRFLQRWLMARVADHGGRPDVALPLLTDLDGATGQFGLARWEPLLTFEVKHHLLRVLKTAMARKDADKPALSRRVEQLQSELTVLDPARAVTL